MRTLFNNIQNLLDSKISITQRGLLVTILLLKDSNPKVWEAKVKASIKMKDHRKDLISLHKAGLIEWRGYKSAVKSIENREIHPDVVEAISFMNRLYGRKFKVTSTASTTALKERLKEYTLTEVKQVIANRWGEWANDPEMKKYLVPYTIFRKSKFEKYLEDVESTDRGKGVVQIQEIGLEEGDEINSDNVDTFIDTEFYFIKAHEYNTAGVRQKIRGDQLKMKVKISNYLITYSK